MHFIFPDSFRCFFHSILTCDLRGKTQEADLIFRPTHMRQLYELSTSPNKTWRPLPGGDHNSSVLEQGYFEAIADFVAEVN